MSWKSLSQACLTIILFFVGNTSQAANLEEVFKKSIETSPDVASQVAIIGQKKSIDEQAKSKMLPSLELSAVVLRQTEPNSGLVSSISPAEQATAKVSVNQSISALYSENV